MKKTEHYLCSHTSRYGEYEESETILISVEEGEDLNAVLKQYAMEDRGSGENDWDEDMGGYWFDGNMTFVPTVERKLTPAEKKVYDDYRNLLYPVSAESNTDSNALVPFTVIGFYDETNQIFSHHVHAFSASSAFAVVAREHESANFVAALPGHVFEGDGIEFVGESIVDSQTVLEQDDVFPQR